MKMTELYDELNKISLVVPKGTHNEVAEKLKISSSYLLKIRKDNYLIDNENNRKYVQEIITTYREVLAEKGFQIPTLDQKVIDSIVQSHDALITVGEKLLAVLEYLDEKVSSEDIRKKGFPHYIDTWKVVDNAKQLRVSHNLVSNGK